MPRGGWKPRKRAISGTTGLKLSMDQVIMIRRLSTPPSNPDWVPGGPPPPPGTLAASPRVFWSARADSDANMVMDIGNPNIFTLDTLNGHSYVQWPGGRKAIRVASGWTGGPGSNYDKISMMGGNWKVFTKHSLHETSYSVGMQQNGVVREMYCRFSFLIDPDVLIGMTDEGVKLPGFESHSGTPNYIDSWSVRMEFRRYGVSYQPPDQPTNAFWFVGYWYGGGWAEGVYGGIIPTTAPYLYTGVIYTCEQHVRLNTFTNGIPNADGIVEIKLDGTLVYSQTNVIFRTQELNPDYGYEEDIGMFWPCLWHGGQTVPSAPIHIELGDMAASTYGWIGLPLTTSTLAQAAASLSPGNWATITAPANQGTVLVREGVGTTETAYSNEATWDGQDHLINYVAKVAGTYPFRHFQYSEATHLWSIKSSNITQLGVFGHAYDYNMFDINQRRVYFKSTADRSIYYADAPDYVWSDANKLAAWPAPGASDEMAQPAFSWRRGMAGVGSQDGGNDDLRSPEGAIGLCVAAANGHANFVIYDIQNATWRTNIDVDFPGHTLGAYERWGSYSPTYNCAVAMIWNSVPVAVRLNSNGTATILSTPPRYAGGNSAGEQYAGLFTCDPASGNFLLLHTDGTFWELNPTGSGTWTQLTGSRTPPSDLYPFGTACAVAVPIPEYGAVLFIASTWHLYKHA